MAFTADDAAVAVETALALPEETVGTWHDRKGAAYVVLTPEQVQSLLVTMPRPDLANQE